MTRGAVPDGGQTKAGDEVFCGSCGKVIKQQAEVCPHCGVRQAAQSSSEEKNPGIAALVSLFIPGAGDLYNGEFGVAVIVFISYFVIVSLWTGLLFFVTIITLGLGAILWFFWPVVFILNPISAYFSYTRAEKINAGELSV